MLAFVQLLILWLSQTLAVKQAIVPEALPMQLFISVSNDAFDTTFEQRYRKFLHFDMLAIDFY